MIIFGTRSVGSNGERGEFHCPQCEGRRGYRERRTRRFVHVYFIPLIPISGVQASVRCDSCRGEFVPEVLQFDPERRMQQAREAFRVAATNVAVTMIAADGEIDEQEVVRASEIVGMVAQEPVDPADIRARAVEALDGRVPLEAALRTVATEINEHGKELLVRMAAEIAVADGDFAKSEFELVLRIAGTLGMSEAHVRGIFTASESAAEEDPSEAWKQA